MQALFRDLQYGARALRTSPGVAVIAIVALTLGIGLTTTVFSIVYGALMRGLPYEGADRIAVVRRANPSRDFERMPVPIHDFFDYRAQQRSFESLAAHSAGTVNVSGSERAERYTGAWVTANTFDVYGVKPVLGRGIQAGEDTPGGERVAVIGYRMWQDRFGGDPSVVGMPLRANGQPFTIVGVMPDRFALPNGAQLWLPMQTDPLATPRGQGQQLTVLGRLLPGATLASASADLAAIAARLAAEHKDTNDGITASAMTFVDAELGPEPRQLLFTMLGAVFLVLLIACANVANLLLDRAAHRTKEVGIRTALGASRLAIVRQFLAEAVVISGVAAMLGLVVAHFGVAQFNRAIVDTNPPAWIDIRLHAPVLLFAIGVALVASIVSGAIPAYQSARADINEVLKDESRGASSFRIGRISRALVVFEVALSCGLLVAAGLMVKSVTKAAYMDPGFDARNVFTARLGFPTVYTDTLMQRQFFLDLEGTLAALPGARSAALTSALPGVGGGDSDFAIEGVAYANDRDYPTTGRLTVSPGFFQTFGMQVLQGRGIQTSDRADALPVVVVSQNFAAKFFAGEDPIGRRIRFGQSESQAPWTTIVGIVPDTYSGDPDEPRGERVYVPLAQNHTNFVSIAVKTGGPPMAITAAVRDAIASLNADMPIYWTYSMEEALTRPLWFVRVFGTIFMIVGAIALFLASVGLYAVMAFSVSRRTREVGIRMALGARELDVVGMIFRQGLLQLGLGMTAGLALAYGVSRLLTMILFEVQPRDPVVFGSVVAVLTVVGLLACLVPARRAVRVDPLVALRAE